MTDARWNYNEVNMVDFKCPWMAMKAEHDNAHAYFADTELRMVNRIKQWDEDEMTNMSESVNENERWNDKAKARSKPKIPARRGENISWKRDISL